jgi:hypothetical protein
LRNLQRPALATATVFDECVSSIGNPGKRADFGKAKDLFITAESDYMNAAKNSTLYQLPATKQKPEAVVFGGLTHGDLKSLYTEQMVPSAKPARKYYDQLIISSPYRKCPFCGFGRATTLDHFLNKSHYPWLSIVPANLIPSCKDCNHGKSTSHADTADKQTIHPYFEDKQLSDDQWLYASVVRTAPPSLEYTANPPAHWDKDLRRRVDCHFAHFDLRTRFAIEAATELGSLRFALGRLHAGAGRTAVVQHLATVAAGEEALFKNSWKTALYQALAESDWYIDGGYLLE